MSAENSDTQRPVGALVLHAYADGELDVGAIDAAEALDMEAAGHAGADNSDAQVFGRTCRHGAFLK